MSNSFRPVWFLVGMAVSVVVFTLLSLHSSPTRPTVQVSPSPTAWATINGVPVNPQHPLGGR